MEPLRREADRIAAPITARALREWALLAADERAEPVFDLAAFDDVPVSSSEIAPESYLVRRADTGAIISVRYLRSGTILCVARSDVPDVRELRVVASNGVAVTLVATSVDSLSCRLGSPETRISILAALQNGTATAEATM
jgi:hypothetical protein